eukprot:4785749-Amphidinium_carterae.1
MVVLDPVTHEYEEQRITARALACWYIHRNLKHHRKRRHLHRTPAFPVDVSGLSYTTPFACLRRAKCSEDKRKITARLPGVPYGSNSCVHTVAIAKR